MLLGSMHETARTAPITKLDQIALLQLETVMRDVSAAYDNFEFYKGVNAINRWINIDVSGFYLEAMKDRLYTGDGGGVVEEVFHGLLRMLTPITPNIVAEAWDHRPEWMKSEDGMHPFHRTLDQPLTTRNLDVSEHIRDDIPWLLNANTALKVAQEEGRAQKKIGSSLESSVILQLPLQARAAFDRYADELASIYVVSSVELDGQVEGSWKFSAEFDAPGGKGKAWVLPPREAKCPRCWRYIAPAEGELCKRCDDIVGVS
jgi:isoleucyl-tRNA synthetase